MKLELCHADTCLPDYWGGHHLAHVQIPVYRGMTLKEIKQAIREEVIQGAVEGCDRIALIISDSIEPEDEKEAEKVYRATMAAINRMKPAKKGQRRFFTDIEAPADDCDDTVYAFFVFMPID